MILSALRGTVRAPSPTASRRRALLLVLVITACCTAAGAVWGHRQDSRHEATAVILINPLVGSPFSPDSTRDDLVNLETEAHLVTSDRVARLVGERIAPEASVQELLDGISVKVPPNTQLLEISARGSTAEEAAERAQAFARTYLDHRKARSESELFDRGAQVYEQIRERSRQLEATAANLSRALPRSPKALLLQQEIVAVTSQIGQLRTQRAALQAQPSNPGLVVTPAAVDSGPTLGWTVLGATAGLVLGLACPILLTVVRARRDPTLKDEEELATVLAHRGVPVLGPSDAPHEVRTSLLAGFPYRPLVVVLATVGTTAGRAVTARGLAASLARSELETVLVDLAEPGGDPDAGPGLTDLLLELTSTQDLLDEGAGVPRRVGPGSHPDFLDDLASAPRMGELVEELKKRADVVLVSGGPLSGPRTRALITHADTVVLESGQVTAHQIETAVDDVLRGGRPVAGVVRVVPADRPRRPMSPWARTS